MDSTEDIGAAPTGVGEVDAHGAPDGRVRWQAPELLATGLATGAVGLFLGFAVAAIDVAGFGTSYAGLGRVVTELQFAEAWLVFAVPPMLLALLAAWCCTTGLGATVGRPADALRHRRVRPTLVAAVALALPTAAAGLVRLIYALDHYSTGGPTQISAVASTAGICVLALAAAGTQALVAGRLLRSGVPRQPPGPSPATADG